MIRAYSQRLLPPYSGFVQIAESDRARAQSLDGISWEIQYLNSHDAAAGGQGRQQGYGLDRSYFRVAHVQDNQVRPYVLPACLKAEAVSASIDELSEFLLTARVPFPAADVFEYWILDGTDQSPLALVFSCCEESQMANYPTHTEWTALPHSKMRIENTADERANEEPPVNHRFQRLVARRAGGSPRGAWFRRDTGEPNDFPPFLVREDWDDEADHQLCQRYLSRKSPRLLMLQGLAPRDRERMEIAAKAHASEVDQFFPMYPEVNDERRMSAIRVEARLRRDMPQQARPKDADAKTGPAPMPKALRILE
jgi:hypothetical protein